MWMKGRVMILGRGKIASAIVEVRLESVKSITLRKPGPMQRPRRVAEMASVSLLLRSLASWKGGMLNELPGDLEVLNGFVHFVRFGDVQKNGKMRNVLSMPKHSCGDCCRGGMRRTECTLPWQWTFALFVTWKTS